MKRLHSDGNTSSRRASRDVKKRAARRSLEVLVLESRLVLSTTPTATALTASAATIAAGQTLTLTADVSDSETDTITGGSVTFKDGTTILGTVSLANNMASLPVSTLATGQHALTANFSGYQGYLASGTGISPTGIITTFAGTGTAGYTGDGGLATSAKLNYPFASATDSAGNLYIADNSNNVIRKVTPSGVISTFAGDGSSGDTGDGGQATSATFNDPDGLAFDSSGNLYISDSGNNVVRKVTPAGIITTFAGNGTSGETGDGGQAISAEMGSPANLAVNASGDLYIAIQEDNVVRMVTPAGIISTVAGTGTDGDIGNGGQATSAEINSPFGIAVDSSGNLYIAEISTNDVRKVSTSGVITNYAGDGTGGYTGDDGQATSAELDAPCGIAVDAAGDLFIADDGNDAVREVLPNGIIQTVAGSGENGYTGDGGPGDGATLNDDENLSVDAAGDLFIDDSSNNAVREMRAAVPVTVTADLTSTTISSNLATAASGQPVTLTATVTNVSNGSITPTGLVTFKDGSTTLGVGSLAGGVATYSTSALTVGSHSLTAVYDGQGTVLGSASGVTPTSLIKTVAGTGTAGDTGDGGQATSAEIVAVATTVDAAGDLFITDATNHVVREVTPNGVIHTFAGDGVSGYTGDGGQATSAEVGRPVGLAVNAAGDLFIDEFVGAAIREVTTNGIIQTVAGGTYGYGGDGGPATSASLSNPSDVIVDAKGDIFIADSTNQVIREVTPDGIIHTFAGTGSQGYSGDGGQATSAELGYPTGVAVDANGDVFIADHDNHVVREVTPDGVIHTVAGTGTAGYSGDGGLATSAELFETAGVTVDAAGDLFIADPTDNVVREVTLDGIIHTVAGSGTAGYSGDGEAATSATLSRPGSLAIDAAGDLFIADGSNNVVREVVAGLPFTVTAAPASHFSVTGIPGSVAAGTAETFTVTALDDAAAVASGYTGTVHFTSTDPDAILPADATLTNGVGTFRVTFKDAGTESITATDIENELTGSESGIVVDFQTVTTLGASASTITTVDSVTLTATVSGLSQEPTPVGGSVVFKDGSTVLGTGTLVNGMATFTTSTLALGPHKLTAVYSGQGSFQPSTTGISPTSTIRTVAGTGTPGYTGDGGPATAAELNYTYGVAFDSAGNMYIADDENHVIRKVTPAGIISTFAGDGTEGDTGDGGQATAAELDDPDGLAFDPAGNLYIADYSESVIRKVTPAGIISTFAGDGTEGDTGDGGQATSAEIGRPGPLTFDSAGNLYFPDYTENVVRKVTPAGVISTVAGTGTRGETGDGGQATAAELDGPFGVAVDSAGNIYISDYASSVIREVTPSGVISTIVGGEGAGDTGDGGPAADAQIDGPCGLAIDAAGDLFIADDNNNVVREITPDGIIHTVAGTGTVAYTGDGGPANAATLNDDEALGLDAAGDLFISDDNNNVIREVDAFLSLDVTPAPATHFSVTESPADPVAGTIETVTVTALDADGNTVTGYTGTVHLTSTDGQAILPPDATLTEGVGTFQVTLKTAGTQSIQATDAETSELTGTDASIDVQAASALSITVTGATDESAGVVEAVTVTALDAFGNVATGYAGTVHVTSSDGRAVLPADATLTEGVGTFDVTLKTAGTQSITATDIEVGQLTGTESGIVVSTGEFTRFAVTGAVDEAAGGVESITVTPEDQYGNAITGEFEDDIHFTSSDGQAVLPPDQTIFGGANEFSVTLRTAGTQSITVADYDDFSGIDSGIVVTAGMATHFSIVPVQGSPNIYTVAALDAFGNLATGYHGTVAMTSNDPSALLPAAASLFNGVGTFRVILETPGNHSITATDTSNPAVTGTQTGIATLTVTGTVYLNLNAAATIQAGDVGLAGRVVFLDLNGDGTLDPGDPRATTNAEGQFLLGGGLLGEFPLLEATDQDASMRYVVDQSSAAGGFETILVVPISPVAPVYVNPAPFTGTSTPNANTAYVQSLYETVLGRAGAGFEVAGWLTVMNSGTTRQQVAASFINSPEHRETEVIAYYREFLHRTPDPLAAVWIDALLAGASEESVSEAILDSHEYQSEHASSVSLVGDLYLDVLGRQGDGLGEAAWISALNSGASRQAIVASFVQSVEAIDQIITSDYAAFLHRQPEIGGPAIWANELESQGGSAAEVAVGILTSPEYENDAATL